MLPVRKKTLMRSVFGALALLALAACGGGGNTSGPPKVQAVSDVQQANILINISAGYGPASWVLLQYDDQAQLFNVFVNRGQLPAPPSGGKPDIATITADPNNWESYARNSITVLGTTTALALDSGSTPNTFTATPQELSDFLSGNSNIVQTAWNEIREK
jgi:predicted small lipoprotein YifL